jgi:hypothetical protein
MKPKYIPQFRRRHDRYKNFPVGPFQARMFSCGGEPVQSWKSYWFIPAAHSGTTKTRGLVNSEGRDLRPDAQIPGGKPASGPMQSLDEIRQRGGKNVVAFAVEGDIDVAAVASNTSEIEWPPKREAAIILRH